MSNDGTYSHIHPMFLKQMDRDQRGEHAIRWLFNSYGLEPVNVNFKSKKEEGYNVVVHFYEGQFHLDYYHFTKDAFETCYKTEIKIPEGDLENVEPEMFEIPIWEFKTMVEGEYFYKKGNLKELIHIFNEQKAKKIERGTN